MMVFLTWLIRWGHVVFAAAWVGGYAMLALAILPRIEKGASESLVSLSIATVRLLTYTGTLTLTFGIVLITRTRSFSNIFGTTWGTLVLIAFVIAIVLLGIGDGALRPAILRRARTGEAPARTWAIVGLILTVIAVAVMTATTYV